MSAPLASEVGVRPLRAYLYPRFTSICVVDFEFGAATGAQPEVRCMVAKELLTGRTFRLWADELAALGQAPFSVGGDSVFVAYFASAELSCFLRLGWPLPERVLDLFVEFKNRLNGTQPPGGFSLLGALLHFDLPALASAEKDSLRQLAQRGGAYTLAERRQLIAYCERDVDALAQLLPRMLPQIDLPRALLRGRYMKAVARMEACGIPVDRTALELLQTNWAAIQAQIIEAVNQDFGVFDGLTFKQARFEQWLHQRGLIWPRLESGRLALDEETFRQMARAYPTVAPLRDVRYQLGQLRLSKLAVGPDHRNRTLLSPFSSRTSRNQPSTSQFIFGPSVWIRSLIKPPPGMGLAYLDYSQQEFGIAAALAGDAAMKVAYQSGDPYLTFAIQAGVAPADATKATHGALRDQFKQCALAVQYGMGAPRLALTLNVPRTKAHQLLALHRRICQRYWDWSDAVFNRAMLYGSLRTVFGWTLHFAKTPDGRMGRTARNFPLQANGAEMLRLACSLATEAGIRVCAPIHDALLVEAPQGELEAVVAQTQACMAEASSIVLDGFTLRSEAELIYPPHRYVDPRGVTMWNKVFGILGRPEFGINEGGQG